MKEHTEILRELREDHDLKQSDIAEKLGITQQYYSKYETGKFELPLRFLLQLAELYGVSTDYLLGRTECREGVDGVNKLVTAGYSTGNMITDVMSLSSNGRRSVIEMIELQHIKEKTKQK